MTKDKKIKRVEVKVPVDMYKRLRKAHPYGFSDFMREHLTNLLDNEDLENWTCYKCLNKNKYNIADLWITLPMKDDEGGLQFILCPDCRKELLTKSADSLSNDLRIVKQLLETKREVSGCLTEVRALCEYFPEIWQHNYGVIISKKLSGEELKEQFKTINAKK